LRGDPSSAVFSASTGFDLPNAAQKNPVTRETEEERLGEEGKGLAA